MESPKNLKNAQTLEMLAKMWMDNNIRGYLENERMKEVWTLKLINTGSIEGDTHALIRQNGRIAYIEHLLNTMKNAYADYERIQTNLKKKDAINK